MWTSGQATALACCSPERQVPDATKAAIDSKIAYMTPGQTTKLIDVLLELPKIERPALPVLEAGTY